MLSVDFMLIGILIDHLDLNCMFPGCQRAVYALRCFLEYADTFGTKRAASRAPETT